MRTVVMGREELAWAAGFFDGEGYIGTIQPYGRMKTPKLTITIAQTDRAVLDRFGAAVGVSRIYGPYVPKSANSNPYWQYSIADFPRCQAVVAKLWTWLSPVKREQAKQALLTAKPRPLKRILCQNQGHNIALRKNGKYECRTCHAAYMRKYTQERKAEAAVI